MVMLKVWRSCAQCSASRRS